MDFRRQDGGQVEELIHGLAVSGRIPTIENGTENKIWGGTGVRTPVRFQKFDEFRPKFLENALHIADIAKGKVVRRRIAYPNLSLETEKNG